MQRRVFDKGDVESAFSNHDVIEKRGKGGFKDVFLAEDDSGEEVVIKLIPIERTQWKSRAEREAEAMRKISSPVFVNLYDHFQTVIDGTEVFVLIEEFVPGNTLRTEIDEGNYGLELGIKVMNSILDVLKETPEHDIVHRDIKPSNVMVTPEGDIRLLDVGIVRFNEKQSLTPDHASRSPHTPRYGAPEQLDNDKENQDVRTDLFATGIVFFETVTGEHPFVVPQKSPSKAIRDGTKHILPEKVENASEVESLLGDLQFLYNTLTQPDSYRRYPNANEVIQEIEEILGSHEWEVEE